MPLDERAAAADALCLLALDLPEVAQASTVAVYLSFGAEPSTAKLLDALSARGARLLAPVLLPDQDLDWAPYDPAERRASFREPYEPEGHRLGPAAVTVADVVIAPALAVDVRGMRLGRGGGSYDRALARTHPGTPVIVLLYDGEVLPDVPAEAHDRAVTAAVTPSRVWRFP